MQAYRNILHYVRCKQNQYDVSVNDLINSIPSFHRKKQSCNQLYFSIYEKRYTLANRNTVFSMEKQSQPSLNEVGSYYNPFFQTLPQHFNL